MALNSNQILTAPVEIGDHALVGAWAIALPGVSVGEQATMAPLAIAEVGCDVAPRTINMGAPAYPVKVSLTSMG